MEWKRVVGMYRIDAGREMLVIVLVCANGSQRRLTELFCAGCVHDF